MMISFHVMKIVIILARLQYLVPFRIDSNEIIIFYKCQFFRNYLFQMLKFNENIMEGKLQKLVKISWVMAIHHWEANIQ
jgi:hypothetical protein